MKYYVGVTDNRWYEFLADLKPDEVNFWRPSGRDAFRAIPQGSPFLFKLHSPLNFIAGGGFFVKFERLSLSMAWDVFEQKNGAPDAQALSEMIRGHRSDGARDPVIGCVVLAEPFFFDRDDWIPAPSNWSRNIVTGKTYDTNDHIGRAVWEEVTLRLEASGLASTIGLLRETQARDANRFGREYMARARLGQGIFRLFVTDAYHRRCAVTGEKVLPALEAAHIKPYKEGGPHRVENGLLLRSDIHKLFDRGYLTLTNDLRVDVSLSIREEFHNGEEYYRLRKSPLTVLPDSRQEQPSREHIEWHQENVFRA